MPSHAENAVDHLSNWGGLAWALHYLVAVVALVVAVGAVLLYDAAVSGRPYISSSRRPLSRGAVAAVWAGGIVGAGAFGLVLPQIARHTAGGRWVAALLLVAASAAAVVGYCALECPTGRPERPLWIVIALLLVGAVALTALSETLTRVAAWIPTTVGSLVVLVAVVLLLVWGRARQRV